MSAVAWAAACLACPPLLALAVRRLLREPGRGPGYVSAWTWIATFGVAANVIFGGWEQSVPYGVSLVAALVLWKRSRRGGMTPVTCRPGLQGKRKRGKP